MARKWQIEYNGKKIILEPKIDEIHYCMGNEITHRIGAIWKNWNCGSPMLLNEEKDFTIKIGNDQYLHAALLPEAEEIKPTPRQWEFYLNGERKVLEPKLLWSKEAERWYYDLCEAISEHTTNWTCFDRGSGKPMYVGEERDFIIEFPHNVKVKAEMVMTLADLKEISDGLNSSILPEGTKIEELVVSPDIAKIIETNGMTHNSVAPDWEKEVREINRALGYATKKAGQVIPPPRPLCDYINEEPDMVNHPPHYTQFPIELKDWNFAVIDTIQDKHWAAYFKTVSEYLHRAHFKNGLEDVEKAIFWLQEAVNKAKEGKFNVK